MFNPIKKRLPFRKNINLLLSKGELVPIKWKKVSPKGKKSTKSLLSRTVVKVKRTYKKLNAEDFLEKKLILLITILIDTLHGKMTYDIMKDIVDGITNEIKEQNFMQRDEHLMIRIIRLTVSVLFRFDTLLLLMNTKTIVAIANEIASNIVKLFSKRKESKTISKQEIVKIFQDKFEHISLQYVFNRGALWFDKNRKKITL